MEEVSGSGTGICCVPRDILEAHILTRLDGPSLASLSCASATLHSLCSQTHLWFNLFHATWPSTATSPHLRHLISAAGDPCSLFSYAFSLPPTTTTASHLNRPSQSTQHLISAVDIHFGDNLIFNKVQETETVSGWFNCSPFRVDLLDPKETVPTRIPHPGGDDSSTCCCSSFLENMKLSWILIDPTRPGLMNLSSFSPVSATRHWLSKEVAVKFATVLGRGNALVECVIVVGCGETEDDDGEVMLQVREVSLEMEDMEGKHLNGKDSIVILLNTMSSSSKSSSLSSSSTKKKGGKGREEEGKRRYREFVEKKKERKERKLRVEWVLDTLSVLFVVASLAFAAAWLIGIAISSV